MFKGGRPRNAIWQYFNEVTVDKKPYAICKSCGNQQLAKANRLIQHHLKCSESDVSQPQTAVKKRRCTSPPPAKCQILFCKYMFDAV